MVWNMQWSEDSWLTSSELTDWKTGLSSLKFPLPPYAWVICLYITIHSLPTSDIAATPTELAIFCWLRPTLPVWHMYLVTTIPQPFHCRKCARWQKYHYPSTVAYVPGDSKTTTLPVWHMCLVSTKPQPCQCGYVPVEYLINSFPVRHMGQVTTKLLPSKCGSVPCKYYTNTLPVRHICQVTTIPLPFQCSICTRWQIHHYSPSVTYVLCDNYTTTFQWGIYTRW